MINNSKLKDGLLGMTIAILLYGGVSLGKITNRQSLISPLMNGKSYFNAQLLNTTIKQVFASVPGWANNHMERVDLTGVQTLSYFDLRLNSDGSIDTTNYGYDLFSGERATTLFQRAHESGVKVVVAVTQGNNDTIRTFLNDSAAQKLAVKNLISEVKHSGIDGVNIDFEYGGDATEDLREKYTRFVSYTKQEFHREFPNSTVAVSLPRAQASQYGLYDLKALGESSDKVFIMAYNFAVPEMSNGQFNAPEYGYDGSKYWNDVSGDIDGFLEYIPADKLVMEKAWYGNGEEYPLYRPTTQAQLANNPSNSQTLRDLMKPSSVENVLQGVPESSRSAARKNLPYIAKALDQEGILNPNVLAYALATIEHETAGTFEPIEEYNGRHSARRLGYEGGTNYFGRGFIQLTHLRNYKMMSERLGLGDKLVEHPELALQPDISAHILAAFFKDNGIATLATNGDFVDARTPINPDYNGWSIANLAYKYLWGING